MYLISFTSASMRTIGPKSFALKGEFELWSNWNCCFSFAEIFYTYNLDRLISIFIITYHI